MRDGLEHVGMDSNSIILTISLDFHFKNNVGSGVGVFSIFWRF